MPTQLEMFVDRWKDCHGCLLAHSRYKVVLMRGVVPASVLIIGEAPGRSENLQGEPFVGPAGKLLDSIIEQSVPTDIDVCLTNVICCIPIREGAELGEPEDEEIHACSTRLIEFVELVEPRLIVTVGKVASHALNPQLKKSVKLKRVVPMVEIQHPAAILRAPEVAQGLSIRRCVVTIRDAVEQVFFNQEQK